GMGGESITQSRSAQKEGAERRLIPDCGDIDSCADAPCQSNTPTSHWTAGRFCNGCPDGARAARVGISEFWYKLGEVVMILDLHRQGLTVSAIARALGVDRKTVRRCITRGLETPVYGPRKPRKR